MKLFVLLSRVPYPLEKGDKLRAYHQIKWLSKKHDVFLCCLTDQAVSQEVMDHLSSMVHRLEIIPLHKFTIGLRLVRGLISTKPYQVHYFYQHQAQRKINALIAEYQPDHIYCQLIRCSEYVKHLISIPKTLDYMDALNAGLHRRSDKSLWYLKAIFKEESKRLVAYENLIFDYFDHHTIISEQDQQLIYHADRKKIVVLPNGVDTDFFTPQQQEHRYQIAFTGNMSYAPNVECAQRLALVILPLVKKEIPTARLLLAGATPSTEVLALQSPDVTVSGWMDDIRDAYAQSSVFAAPMQLGSGLQNKLLEAMSMELPCVTSPLAANALGPQANQVLCICESDEQVADQIIRLLRDRPAADDLAKKGRQFVHEKFNWENTVIQLEKLFFGKP
ncbi:MAG: glycosyltransferase [Flavobacteriales bacterium]